MAAQLLTEEKIVAAIQKKKGYVADAAKALGVSTQTIYNYCERYPAITEAIQEAREQRHDFVENALMKRIRGGDTTAMIFYLKTQGRGRGWQERQEISGPNGGPLQSTSAQVHIYIPENFRG